MMALVTCVMTSMMTSPSSAGRVDCGFPGIDGIRCMERGCLWDPVDVPRRAPAVGNEPWCYKMEGDDDGDDEHSLSSAERESYKKARPVRLTNATVREFRLASCLCGTMIYYAPKQLRVKHRTKR